MLDNNQLYLKQTEKSQEVNNIVPWLVNQVLSNGGEIVCLTKNDALLNNRKIGAELRY